MIGDLPSTFLIGEHEVPVRSDYRIALIIFQALNDADLSGKEKEYIMLDALIGFENIPDGEIRDADEKCRWFLNGGKAENKSRKNDPRLLDWQQDEQMIFSAVNHIAGKELRAVSYCHWWTFLGYFNEIQDGLFSTVVDIRSKRARGKKLEPWEKEYYSRNKDLVDIRKPETTEEKEYREALNARFR